MTDTPSPIRDDEKPNLLTRQELCGLLGMNYVNTGKWIHKHIIPRNGAVKIGTKVYVHAWAVNAALTDLIYKPTSRKRKHRLVRRPGEGRIVGVSRGGDDGCSDSQAADGRSPARADKRDTPHPE